MRVRESPVHVTRSPQNVNPIRQQVDQMGYFVPKNKDYPCNNENSNPSKLNAKDGKNPIFRNECSHQPITHIDANEQISPLISELLKVMKNSSAKGTEQLRYMNSHVQDLEQLKQTAMRKKDCVHICHPDSKHDNRNHLHNLPQNQNSTINMNSIIQNSNLTDGTQNLSVMTSNHSTKGNLLINSQNKLAPPTLEELSAMSRSEETLNHGVKINNVLYPHSPILRAGLPTESNSKDKYRNGDTREYNLNNNIRSGNVDTRAAIPNLPIFNNMAYFDSRENARYTSSDQSQSYELPNDSPLSTYNHYQYQKNNITSARSLSILGSTSERFDKDRFSHLIHPKVISKQESDHLQISRSRSVNNNAEQQFKERFDDYSIYRNHLSEVEHPDVSTVTREKKSQKINQLLVELQFPDRYEESTRLDQLNTETLHEFLYHLRDGQYHFSGSVDDIIQLGTVENLREYFRQRRIIGARVLAEKDERAKRQSQQASSVFLDSKNKNASADRYTTSTKHLGSRDENSGEFLDETSGSSETVPSVPSNVSQKYQNYHKWKMRYDNGNRDRFDPEYETKNFRRSDIDPRDLSYVCDDANSELPYARSSSKKIEAQTFQAYHDWKNRHSNILTPRRDSHLETNSYMQS